MRPFTSRSGTGEGSLARFREPTSSLAPRSSTAGQSKSTPQPGFAGETGGEPLPSAFGRATRTTSRFELRLGCAARGGPHGQRETIADAKLWLEKMVGEGKKPLTRPATAGESAVAGHPLPTGEGYISDLGTRGVQPKMWDMTDNLNLRTQVDARARGGSLLLGRRLAGRSGPPFFSFSA